jgi:hypothetical protein
MHESARELARAVDHEIILSASAGNGDGSGGSAMYALGGEGA